MHMNMVWVVHLMANLDSRNPRMLDDFLNGNAALWIWLQHTSDQTSTRSGRKVVDCRRAARLRWLGGSASRRIGLVEGISALCCPPRQLLEVKTVVNNPTCPDVD